MESPASKPNPLPKTPSLSMEESVCVAECKRGKLEYFEPIVRQHQGRLGVIAYQILRNEGLAEEAVQTTFVKAWQKIQQFRGDCSLGTWLHRMCVNTACDMIRHNQRKRETPMISSEDSEQDVSLDTILPSDQNTDRDILNRETKQLVLQALSKLPEDQRLTLVLREMQGLDYREIAQTMKCREGTVMSRLFHGRRKLRELLEKII